MDMFRLMFASRRLALTAAMALSVVLIGLGFVNTWFLALLPVTLGLSLLGPAVVLWLLRPLSRLAMPRQGDLSACPCPLTGPCVTRNETVRYF